MPAGQKPRSQITVVDPEPRILKQVENQPHPLIFVTISGAHLYGFPSPDSDYDLRGVHVLPIEQIVGLASAAETIESAGFQDGLEIDLVTHDARKFFSLMLKKNGYVLEQLYSPLIVHSTSEHEELKQIGRGCITRHHAHHYFGFAETQWKLFEKGSPRRVKPLLYVYRVLLTGIHLMRTGEVESNLAKMVEWHPLPIVPDLIARKLSGPEKSALSETDYDHHRREYERLREELQSAFEVSQLPETASSKPALHDLLLRVRGVTAKN
jgi:hypothetical protein